MGVRLLHPGREESRPEWAAVITSELDLIHDKLQSVIVSTVPEASEMCTHLLAAGGKRLRPALVVMAHHSCAGELVTESLIDVAAAVEVMHMASLVHDDVIDETRQRRGVSTANARWGNKLSVLGGDFLLAKTFRLLGTVADIDVIRVISQAAVVMTESEVLQAARGGSITLWESNYWNIIRDKTASLMSACCQCGAVLAGADEDARNALAQYGIHLGLAFQVMDDILDISGSPSRTGKAVGTDLSHGKFTLPVLLALQHADSGVKRKILQSQTGDCCPVKRRWRLPGWLLNVGPLKWRAKPRLRVPQTRENTSARCRNRAIRTPWRRSRIS